MQNQTSLGKQLPSTNRLLFRELINTDLTALAAILQDPLTMAAYEGPFTDAEVSAWLAKQQSNYLDYGFGLWAVVLKGTGAVIGQCGITWQNIPHTVPFISDAVPPTAAGDWVLEVGYLFNRAFWHQGYATEAARAAVHWAFDHLRASEIYAQVRDTNLASMNVAIRCGMTIQDCFIKHYRGIEMPHYAFSIEP